MKSVFLLLFFLVHKRVIAGIGVVLTTQKAKWTCIFNTINVVGIEHTYTCHCYPHSKSKIEYFWKILYQGYIIQLNFRQSFDASDLSRLSSRGKLLYKINILISL